MKCLILAAGYATRLYPLTENFPKPLLPVGGKPILDWLTGDIASSVGVDEYVVVSNHKFAGHFRSWAVGTGLHVTVADDGSMTNETRLGAVRDVQFAVESLGIDDDLLVIAGDNLLDFSLGKFVGYAMDKGTSAIMRYYEPDKARLRKCGVLQVDGDGLVTDMVEKPSEPRSHWCCPPFYFYTRMDVRRIPDGIASGCGTDAPGSYVSWLCKQAPVHAMEMPGRRYDIGSVESYRQVCAEYKGITA